MAELRLPRLGSTMDEGMIVAWKVAAGESFSSGDVLYEVTTDKVNMEVEADHPGMLAKILVAEGQSVRVGEPVAWVEGRDWDDTSVGGTPAPQPAIPERDKEPAKRGDAPTSGLRASPAARRRGRELGINIQTIVGTGPQGRILQRDVERAGQMATGSGFRSTEGSVSLAPVGTEKTPPPSKGTPRPFTGIRAITAQRMSQSAGIPQVTLSSTVRLDDVETTRSQLKGRTDAPVSLIDFVLLAVVRGLVRHSDLNGWVENNAFIPASQVDLGYAVNAPDRGLYVVCLGSAERLRLQDMARRRRNLTQKVLQGTASPEDLGQPSFTVTNLGPYGVEWFNPLINPPQVGILAVGSAQEWGGSRRMTLSLTFDHRAVDGAPAAEFLQDVKAGIENLGLLL